MSRVRPGRGEPFLLRVDDGSVRVPAMTYLQGTYRPEVGALVRMRRSDTVRPIRGARVAGQAMSPSGRAVLVVPTDDGGETVFAINARDRQTIAVAPSLVRDDRLVAQGR